jgi:hypothetical protein
VCCCSRLLTYRDNYIATRRPTTGRADDGTGGRRPTAALNAALSHCSRGINHLTATEERKSRLWCHRYVLSVNKLTRKEANGRWRRSFSGSRILRDPGLTSVPGHRLRNLVGIVIAIISRRSGEPRPDGCGKPTVTFDNHGEDHVISGYPQSEHILCKCATRSSGLGPNCMQRSIIKRT